MVDGDEMAAVVLMDIWDTLRRATRKRGSSWLAVLERGYRGRTDCATGTRGPLSPERHSGVGIRATVA